MNPDSEHLIFSAMINNLKLATSGARSLANHRPDQPWVKVADKLEELTQMLYSMVGDGHVKGIIQ